MSNSKTSNSKLSRDEQLKKEGWTRKFLYDEPRLSEAVEMYESMGLEVRLEPVTPEDMADGCSVCLDVDLERYKIIYTRPRK